MYNRLDSQLSWNLENKRHNQALGHHCLAVRFYNTLLASKFMFIIPDGRRVFVGGHYGRILDIDPRQQVEAFSLKHPIRSREVTAPLANVLSFVTDRVGTKSVSYVGGSNKPITWDVRGTKPVGRGISLSSPSGKTVTSTELSSAPHGMKEQLYRQTKAVLDPSRYIQQAS